MGSYAQTLDDDRNEAVQLLWELGVTDCIRSNHTDRLYNIIMAKVPAFGALPELRFEKFMGDKSYLGTSTEHRSFILTDIDYMMAGNTCYNWPLEEGFSFRNM